MIFLPVCIIVTGDGRQLFQSPGPRFRSVWNRQPAVSVHAGTWPDRQQNSESIGKGDGVEEVLAEGPGQSF